jgi:phosphatidylinositol alpha-1,6-mannosyltransferase
MSGLEMYPLLPNVTPQEPHSLLKMMRLQNKIGRLVADCDLIHTTIELYAPLLALIAQQHPTVMTAHGTYINLPKMRHFPVNMIYRNAFETTHITCVSHYTQKIAQNIVPKAESSVILNAIDAEKFANIEHRQTEHPIIVSSGGVKARKGTLPLVRAVAKVREVLPNVECHILGSLNAEPPYLEQVKAEIGRLKLEDTVYLHGFVSDEELQDWYAKATVFALPSINAGWKFEGFGLATLEASAAGLAVIGTRDCGAEDAIDHEETGLLISQEHIAEELPRALLDLLNNREKAAQMGIAGRQKAKSYAWDDVAKQFISLYKSKLKR